MHAQPRKLDAKRQIEGWPRAAEAPLLWSSCSLELATHARKIMRAALLLAIVAEEAPALEQGESDSTGRRSEAHPGPAVGYALSTLVL